MSQVSKPQTGKPRVSKTSVSKSAAAGSPVRGAPVGNPPGTDFLLRPALHLGDGRIVHSFADAVALVREHESRPGIDTRDEVLHRLERARTDAERQAAAEAFYGWANELNLLATAKAAARD
jgi:hypothetical protein